MNKRTVKYEELDTKQKENFKNMVVEMNYHNGISRDNLIALIKDMAKENEQLKARLEKVETTLFITVRNNILEKREERGVPINMVDKIAARTTQTMEEMIDYPSATKKRIEAEKALKERE